MCFVKLFFTNNLKNKTSFHLACVCV